MARKLKLLEKRFGRLVVIADAGSRKQKYGADSLWLCKCDCGKEKIILGKSLKNGSTKSCGCYFKDSTRKRMSLSKGEAALNKIYSKYKYQAKIRKICWKLTKKQFKEITSKRCYLCGVSPKQSIKKSNPKFNGDYIYNGIDRIDNNKGYTIDNVAACCGKCNKMKLNLSYDEFLEHIKKILYRPGFDVEDLYYEEINEK